MPRTYDSYITFVLREPRAVKETPIIGIIRFDNNQLKVATGFTILPKLWDGSKGRVCNVIAATLKTPINNHLIELENAARTIIPDLKAKRITITKELVRKCIDEHFEKKNPPVKSTEPALYTFVANFIEQSPDRINIHNGKHVERRTIQKYETVFKVIKEFATTYNRPVDFDTIDLDFYDAFMAYLTKEKNFAINNIGKYIQTLKVFLNEASSKGIVVKQDYRSRRFKVVKEDSDSIYFNEAELMQLYCLDLTNNKRLERVRDLFIVGCYTGLRFSDLINLRPEYIVKNVIRLEQFKSIDKVIIPCHTMVKELLKKYDYELPRSISNQKMNDYLKELCELAGFNSRELKAVTKGGKRIVDSIEKYKLVGTHTARRSFATNMYLMNIPSITIMKITGHKTEKAFMRYIKLDKEQHAKIIADLWEKKYAEAL